MTGRGSSDDGTEKQGIQNPESRSKDGSAVHISHVKRERSHDDMLLIASRQAGPYREFGGLG
jgi:hypothetical protein